MTMHFRNLLVTLLIVGCQPASQTNLPEPLRIPGRIDEAQDCSHQLIVDVLVADESEPINIPDVAPNGNFSISLPHQYHDTPLHVQGFCYASEKALANNTSAWQTEPLRVLPNSLSAEQIVLRRNPLQQEPAIQESVPTEWTHLAKVPAWVQFYGLRHPDHESNYAGQQPEIRGAGLTVDTRCTHLYALYSRIATNTTADMHPLLLPSRAEIFEICQAKDPTDIRFQIMATHLHNSCLVLNLTCPKVGFLRHQQWIPQDKRFIGGETAVRQNALLWLLFQLLVQEATAQGKRSELETFIPRFNEGLAVDCQVVSNGFERLHIPLPAAATTWLRECLISE